MKMIIMWIILILSVQHVSGQAAGCYEVTATGAMKQRRPELLGIYTKVNLIKNNHNVYTLIDQGPTKALNFDTFQGQMYWVIIIGSWGNIQAVRKVPRASSPTGGKWRYKYNNDWVTSNTKMRVDPCKKTTSGPRRTRAPRTTAARPRGKWHFCMTIRSWKKHGHEIAPCVFPFIFKGESYSNCISMGSMSHEFWCPTKLDSNGMYEPCETCWGYCDIVKCSLDTACFETQKAIMPAVGKSDIHINIPTPEKCLEKCRQSNKCVQFNWMGDGNCWLSHTWGTMHDLSRSAETFVTGPQHCDKKNIGECSGSYEYGVEYDGYNLLNCDRYRLGTPEECQQICLKLYQLCNAWEWGSDGTNCCLKHKQGRRKNTGKSGLVSGLRYACKGDIDHFTSPPTTTPFPGINQYYQVSTTCVEYLAGLYEKQNITRNNYYVWKSLASTKNDIYLFYQPKVWRFKNGLGEHSKQYAYNMLQSQPTPTEFDDWAYEKDGSWLNNEYLTFKVEDFTGIPVSCGEIKAIDCPNCIIPYPDQCKGGDCILIEGMCKKGISQYYQVTSEGEKDLAGLYMKMSIKRNNRPVWRSYAEKFHKFDIYLLYSTNNNFNRWIFSDRLSDDGKIVAHNKPKNISAPNLYDEWVMWNVNDNAWNWSDPTFKVRDFTGIPVSCGSTKAIDCANCAIPYPDQCNGGDCVLIEGICKKASSPSAGRRSGGEGGRQKVERKKPKTHKMTKFTERATGLSTPDQLQPPSEKPQSPTEKPQSLPGQQQPPQGTSQPPLGQPPSATGLSTPDQVQPPSEKPQSPTEKPQSLPGQPQPPQGQSQPPLGQPPSGQGQCQTFSNVYDQEDYVFQSQLDAMEFKNRPGSGWNERCSTEVGIYKEISTNTLVCFGASDMESPNLEQEDKLYRCTDSTVGPVESTGKDTTRVPMSTLVDTLSTKKDTTEVPSSPPVVSLSTKKDTTERPQPIETTTTHTTEATPATLITATTTKATRTTEAIHTTVSMTPPARVIRVDTKLTETELSPKINDKIPEPIQRTPVARVSPAVVPPVAMQPRVNIDKVPEEVQNYPAVNPDYPNLPEPDVSVEEPSVVTPDYPYPAPELGDAEKEPTDEYPAGYPDAVDDDIVDKDPTHDEPEYALAPAPGDDEKPPTLFGPSYDSDIKIAEELLGDY